MLKVVKNEKTEDDIAKTISKYIAAPPENSRVVTITPAIAAWVLETHNISNRPKKPKNIAQYAKDMAAGKWGLTGDTLKFSDKHTLRDGQNRLAACVRSGCDFITHVVFGIPDGTFFVMDTGKPRGSADVLSIAGYSNTNNLASALRWAHILSTDPMSRTKITNEQMLGFVRGPFSGVEASMKVGTRLYSQYTHPVGQMAALHWLFSEVDGTLADSFFDDWSTGKRGGRAKALARLQDTLVAAKNANHGRIHDNIRAAMIVKGWNLYYRKRTGGVKSCLMALGEEFPQVEGM